MSSWALTKYKIRNWLSYNTALKQRGSLSIWFDPEMVWTPPPTGQRGRQRQFSEAAIQTCLTLKVLFGMPLRQATGFVESLLRLVGLDWTVPDFSTLCRRQKTLNVNLPYRGSTGPLNLLIPSRDIAAQCTAGQWTAQVSRQRAKSSGTPANTAALNAECGVRYT
ncbi:Transposase DDE domain-containing protein [Antarctobacter heliothermus]|uniref:Transposase DDE domain-containing protein n=1 Tax=Antarctobacter heliothermus TaxID=74033 RepID=A0A239LF43_9RHOB|nr:Transposase DDE domain-containing protein [Antarctobacter heliothermus]